MSGVPQRAGRPTCCSTRASRTASTAWSPAAATLPRHRLSPTKRVPSPRLLLRGRRRGSSHVPISIRRFPIQPERTTTLERVLPERRRARPIAHPSPRGGRTQTARASGVRPSPTLTRDEQAWRYLAVTLKSPPGAAFATVQIERCLQPAAGSLYVDDVQFGGPTAAACHRDASGDQHPLAGPSLTPTPSASATPTHTPVASGTRPPLPTPTPTPRTRSALINGGFEEADDGVPSGWQKYGGELLPDVGALPKRTATRERSAAAPNRRNGPTRRRPCPATAPTSSTPTSFSTTRPCARCSSASPGTPATTPAAAPSPSPTRRSA